MSTIRVEKYPLQQMLCEKQELTIIRVSQTQPCFGGCSMLALTYFLRIALKQKDPTPYFSRNCHFIFRQSLLQSKNVHRVVFSLKDRVYDIHRQHFTRFDSTRAAPEDNHNQQASTVHLTLSQGNNSELLK